MDLPIVCMRIPMSWLLFHPHSVGYVPHYGWFLMFGLTGLTGLSGRFSNINIHQGRYLLSYRSCRRTHDWPYGLSHAPWCSLTDRRICASGQERF